MHMSLRTVYLGHIWNMTSFVKLALPHPALPLRIFRPWPPARIPQCWPHSASHRSRSWPSWGRCTSWKTCGYSTNLVRLSSEIKKKTHLSMIFNWIFTCRVHVPWCRCLSLWRGRTCQSPLSLAPGTQAQKLCQRRREICKIRKKLWSRYS